jgi:integrase
MASLQARHSRKCALGRPWTTFEAARAGCTCKGGPLYHVVTRVHGRKSLVRDPVGHDRRIAERALNKTRHEIDEGKFVAPTDITFAAWADKWLAKLRRPNANTRRSYVSTIDYGKAAFGDKIVRKLTREDVDRFLALMAKRSPATQRKHLRVLRSCLKMAVRQGYAARNPVDELEPEELPTVEKVPPSYFTDAELARLWQELDNGEPVYLYLCKAALATGARQGELLELRWSDVHLLEGEIKITRAYTERIGVGTPKSGKGRTVDLTPQARAVFEEWFALSGETAGPIFASPAGEYLTSAHLTKQILYPAMERASIPRVGEGGRERTFHSFRHSFARTTLEHGASLTWVKEQLGHSSITLTVDRYGRWEDAARKKQAEALEGAFAL